MFFFNYIAKYAKSETVDGIEYLTVPCFHPLKWEVFRGCGSGNGVCMVVLSPPWIQEKSKEISLVLDQGLNGVEESGKSVGMRVVNAAKKLLGKPALDVSDHIPLAHRLRDDMMDCDDSGHAILARRNKKGMKIASDESMDEESEEEKEEEESQEEEGGSSEEEQRKTNKKKKRKTNKKRKKKGKNSKHSKQEMDEDDAEPKYEGLNLDWNDYCSHKKDQLYPEGKPGYTRTGKKKCNCPRFIAEMKKSRFFRECLQSNDTFILGAYIKLMCGTKQLAISLAQFVPAVQIFHEHSDVDTEFAKIQRSKGMLYLVLYKLSTTLHRFAEQFNADDCDDPTNSLLLFWKTLRAPRSRLILYSSIVNMVEAWKRMMGAGWIQGHKNRPAGDGGTLYKVEDCSTDPLENQRNNIRPRSGKMPSSKSANLKTEFWQGLTEESDPFVWLLYVDPESKLWYCVDNKGTIDACAGSVFKNTSAMLKIYTECHCQGGSRWRSKGVLASLDLTLKLAGKEELKRRKKKSRKDKSGIIDITGDGCTPTPASMPLSFCNNLQNKNNNSENKSDMDEDDSDENNEEEGSTLSESFDGIELSKKQ